MSSSISPPIIPPTLVVTSGEAAVFAENGTGAAYTATGTDPQGDAMTWALSGDDAALFDIDANTGVVTFKATPDYEMPSDLGADNVYNITVMTTDNVDSSASLDVTITVEDKNEAPSVSLALPLEITFGASNNTSFVGIDVGSSSSPAFGDLDGDGDADLVVGASDGTLQAYERTAVGFSAFAINPFASIDVGSSSSPALADLDADGDVDLVVGAGDGTLSAYQQTADGFKAFPVDL